MKRVTLIATVAVLLFCACGPAARAAANIPGVEAQPASYFYTGKPYDNDSDAYTFAARVYSPEFNRWTSADPSGFPDGANNHVYCINTPLDGVDPTGFLFLCYSKKAGTLTVWSGTGKTSQGIDWGDADSHWGAVSGGAVGKPAIQNGWWQVGKRAPHLGTPDDVTATGEISESDWQTADGVWHEGSMSVWKNQDRGQGHTQYKYALKALEGQNDNGIKLHPDGPAFGVTHGCIGISGYDDAVGVDGYLQNHSGMQLLVE